MSEPILILCSRCGKDMGNNCPACGQEIERRDVDEEGAEFYYACDKRCTVLEEDEQTYGGPCIECVVKFRAEVNQRQETAA